uniref:Secreted protein n=1 Tax=Kalanchoe fedtschenkoi TaxID=63787 RepID=A0A7N0V102_KALFE
MLMLLLKWLEMLSDLAMSGALAWQVDDDINKIKSVLVGGECHGDGLINSTALPSSVSSFLVTTNKFKVGTTQTLNPVRVR